MMVERLPGSLLSANRLDEIGKSQAKTLERLSTGKSINTASDDAAGLAVSMALESQFRGLSREIANRQDEISLVQTAEGAMGGVTDAVQRIRELSVQSSNGTYTDSDRQAIQMEIDQLKSHIDQTANNTEFNTKKLLDGTLDISLQNGNSLKIPSMTSSSLGISNLNASTQSGANTAISFADQALQTVTSQRGTLGALQNGITSEAANLQNQMINTMAANSRIADADIAKEVMDLTRSQIQTQASIKAFKVDNAMRANVLQLLG